MEQKLEEGSILKWWVPPVVILGWWMYELHFLWNDLPDYSFGWIVLMLGGYLIWERWENWSPAPSSSPNKTASWLLFLGGLTLIVISVLYKWVFARTPAFSLGISLGCLLLIVAMLQSYAGGAAVRHFLFPLLFVFVAVPLPQIIWNPIILGLQNLVTMVNVELLNIVGIPAVRHGSVIQLPNCLVGVDEACSGVRSLQSSVMASLFISDVSLRGKRHKNTLVVMGVLLALVGNMVRAFYLSWTAFRYGEERLHQVHDSAGWGILLFTSVGLVLAAWLISKLSPTSGNRGDLESP